MSDMKPILFNTDMVRSILDGRKTVTRRVIKPQPTKPRWNNINWLGWDDGHGYKMRQPYMPGDVLYVRETWKVHSARRFDANVKIEFKAGGNLSTIQFPGGGRQHGNRYQYDRFMDKWMKDGDHCWHPSIHMPKEAARLFLRVTDVRVERLQSSFFEPVSPIFAIQSEGIDIGDQCRECIENYGCPCCVDTVDEDGTDLYGEECGLLDAARADLSYLWDSTIKPTDRNRYGWEVNPWVWVIEFERISKEEAAQC